jgi:hypothetical protein
MLQPAEAAAQRAAIKVQVAAALVMREEAVAMRYAWTDRYHAAGSAEGG